jgi:protein gp37
MGEATKIQWCDHTWSPWRGCTHAVLADGSEHPGCENCYAEQQSRQNPTVMGTWGRDGARVLSGNWRVVRSWDKASQERIAEHREYTAEFDLVWSCRPAPHRATVFPSLCDPFEEWDGEVHDHQGNACFTLPSGEIVRNPELFRADPGDESRYTTLDDVRRQFFRLIDETPNLDWLLLTKRPQNVRRMWEEKPQHLFRTPCDAEKRDNVWLGVSVSDQQTANELIPQLVRLRDLCGGIFVSCEPLLWEVNLHLATQCDRNCAEHQEAFCPGTSGKCSLQNALDWVIVGGESGTGARFCHTHWVRSLIAQCRSAHVPCFVKQLGSRVRNVSGELVLLDSKGGDPSEWTGDLRVREMPNETIDRAQQ